MAQISRKTSVGIFGTGNIGSDLMAKLLKSDDVSIEFVVGRRDDSPGIKLARKSGIPSSVEGIAGLRAALESAKVDWVADTSSAETHILVREAVLPHSGIRLLDFTPSALSEQFCPGALEELPDGRDIGLISCGGQSSIPLVSLLRRRWEIKSVELTSALASKSVGPATRANLDEYITKTERALRHYSGTEDVKVILIVNPAAPPINMRVSLFVQFTESIQTDEVDRYLLDFSSQLNEYIPNFRLLGKTAQVGDDLLISFQVTGFGDYLPPYAGNLDILTHTAVNIFTDERWGKHDPA